MDYVWLAVALLVMAGLWWVAYRMEPHWSAKDGRSFMCTAQALVDDAAEGRLKETRVYVTPDGALRLTQKHMMRRRSTMCALVAKAPNATKKLSIYVVEETSDGHGLPIRIALRIPSKSRVVPVLDDALAAIELRASRRGPGTAAPADPPDPG